jgi:hypothetical protein
MPVISPECHCQNTIRLMISPAKACTMPSPANDQSELLLGSIEQPSLSSVPTLPSSVPTLCGAVGAVFMYTTRFMKAHNVRD